MNLSRIPNSKFIRCENLLIGNNRQEDDSEENDINIFGTNNRIVLINGEESQPLINPTWGDIVYDDTVYEPTSAYGDLRIQRLEVGANYYLVQMTGVVQRVDGPASDFPANGNVPLVLFTLPVGYRPEALVNFNNIGTLPDDGLVGTPYTGGFIRANGEVCAAGRPGATGSRKFYSLNQMEFFSLRS